jgi:hypothetical protein
MLQSLTEVERAIRASWSADTCDPVDLPWSPSNAAKGQCGVTALVVHDLLGGELLMAEVRHADGSRQGVHYWNRLHGGAELDLTREQFGRGEVVGESEPVIRPADTSRGRLARQYLALADAVSARLP